MISAGTGISFAKYPLKSGVRTGEPKFAFTIVKARHPAPGESPYDVAVRVGLRVARPGVDER
eukprot:1866128-Pleurochrysis_carterae.AAC.1